jgi:hypothetical protein
MLYGCLESPTDSSKETLLVRRPQSLTAGYMDTHSFIGEPGGCLTVLCYGVAIATGAAIEMRRHQLLPGLPLRVPSALQNGEADVAPETDPHTETGTSSLFCSMSVCRVTIIATASLLLLSGIFMCLGALLARCDARTYCRRSSNARRTSLRLGVSVCHATLPLRNLRLAW